MFEDEDFYQEHEEEMEKAIEKYESMLKDHDSVYFDSEEFEYIIDHYTQHNELKRSRQAVELAMEQHPESNMLKIKMARQYLLENDAQRAFDIMQHVERIDDDEDPDYFLTLGSCLAVLGKSEEALENYFSALPYFDEDEKFDLYNAIAYERDSLLLPQRRPQGRSHRLLPSHDRQGSAQQQGLDQHRRHLPHDGTIRGKHRPLRVRPQHRPRRPLDQHAPGRHLL